MKEKMNMTNAEERVMKHIWAEGRMVTVPEMVERLNAEGEEWAYQTVATFLKHLEEKGFLSVTKTGRKLCYFPLISQEQYKRMMAEGFLDNVFDGSFENFLSAFRGSKKIGKKEVQALKEWLDGYDD